MVAPLVLSVAPLNAAPLCWWERSEKESASSAKLVAMVAGVSPASPDSVMPVMLALATLVREEMATVSQRRAGAFIGEIWGEGVAVESQDRLSGLRRQPADQQTERLIRLVESG